jgi:hypothetical protein
MLVPPDVVILDRQERVAWRDVELASPPPAPREKHTLTALAGGRLLMFGGAPFARCKDLSVGCLLAGTTKGPLSETCEELGSKINSEQRLSS